MVAVGLPVPDAPASLTAMPGVGEAELEWTAAPDDGGSPETGSSFTSVNSVRPSTADGRRGRDSAQYVAAGGRCCAVGVPAESTGRATRHDCIADPADEPSRRGPVRGGGSRTPRAGGAGRALRRSAWEAAPDTAHLAREAPGALAWESQFAFTREPTGAETRPLSQPFRGDGHANDARAATPFLYIQTTASSIREGESGTVTAAWSEALADSLTITLSPTSKGNTTTDDHTVTGGLVLVIPPGETTSPDTVTIAVADNDRTEIGYAASRGKPIRYVSDEPDLLARIAPLNQGAVA